MECWISSQPASSKAKQRFNFRILPTNEATKATAREWEKLMWLGLLACYTAAAIYDLVIVVVVNTLPFTCRSMQKYDDRFDLTARYVYLCACVFAFRYRSNEKKCNRIQIAFGITCTVSRPLKGKDPKKLSLCFHKFQLVFYRKKCALVTIKYFSFIRSNFDLMLFLLPVCCWAAHFGIAYWNNFHFWEFFFNWLKQHSLGRWTFHETNNWIEFNLISTELNFNA